MVDTNPTLTETISNVTESIKYISAKVDALLTRREPAGVIINDSEENQTMADKKDADEKIMDKKDEEKVVDKKDAEDPNTKKLDAIMDAVMDMKKDSNARFDALNARCDAMEGDKKDSAKKDSAKKDGGDVGKGEEEGEAKKVAADADKKDGEDDKKEDKKEDAKKDSVDPEVMKRIDNLEKNMPVALTDDDRTKLSEEQVRADDVFNGFGQSAPHPQQGESPTAYRRRCANMLKANSKVWKNIELAKLDGDALNIAVDQIYHDSVVSATAPVASLGKKEIVVERRDRNTGHMVRTFRGSRSFVRAFTMPSRVVTDLGIRRDSN